MSERFDETWPTTELAADLHRFLAVKDVLHSDVEICNERIATLAGPDGTNVPPAEEVAFWVRTLIRAFFAEIEGNLWHMRQIILRAAKRGEFVLKFEEEAVLREETYRVAGGRAKGQAAFAPIHEMVRLTITLMAELLNVNYEVNVSSSGWRSFRDAVNVRNAITHPKSVETFTPSRAELRTIDSANAWYHEQLRQMVSDELLDD